MDDDLSGDFETPEWSNNSNNGRSAETASFPKPYLTVSASLKEAKTKRRGSARPSMDADEFMNLLHGSDPVKVELNRLENEVRGERNVI